jgi:hypothetical protein
MHERILPIAGGDMSWAWSMRIVSCILIATVLAAPIPQPVRAQGADEIDALNRQFARLYGQRKYAEAQTTAERACALAESALGQDHPVTLTSVNNLAVLYAGMGRDGEAGPLWRLSTVKHPRNRLGGHRVWAAEIAVAALVFGRHRIDDADLDATT